MYQIIILVSWSPCCIFSTSNGLCYYNAANRRPACVPKSELHLSGNTLCLIWEKKVLSLNAFEDRNICIWSISFLFKGSFHIPLDWEQDLSNRICWCVLSFHPLNLRSLHEYRWAFWQSYLNRRHGENFQNTKTIHTVEMNATTPQCNLSVVFYFYFFSVQMMAQVIS